MLVPSIPNRFWSGPVIEVWFVVEVVIPRRKRRLVRPVRITIPVGFGETTVTRLRVLRIESRWADDSSQAACAELLPPALR